MLSERIANDPIATHQLKDSDWGYGQLLSTLLHRKVWFISIFLGTLAVAILLTLKTKPLYQSSMQVLVEPNYKGRVNGSVTTAAEISDPQVHVDITTQLQILQSSELLQKAVDRLLTTYPDFTLDNLQQGLTLFPVYGSDANNKKIQTNLLQIDFIDSDPIRSQQVLHTLLPIYQAYNLEQQKLRLAKGLSFINEQLPMV
ncbi:MAG: Wzz/FepE/Etk N-terminal domain-containing protein, partial [Thermosynechococcaceae cyanobacterium]